MDIRIRVELDYALEQTTDILLQIEAARLDGQVISEPSLELTGNTSLHRVDGEDNIGERIWLRCEDRLTASYSARAAIGRPMIDCTELAAMPLHELPSETVKYLMGSRYCDVAKFQSFVAQEFGDPTGGAKIIAMRDWIEDRLSYVPGSSNAGTTAVDTFVARQGICRDYAHVLIAMARAAAIPARMVSVYALGVDPQDFHAVAEVYLDGSWHLVDPTGMAKDGAIAKIGVGRDAADISFLTAYGRATMNNQSVNVEET